MPKEILLTFRKKNTKIPYWFMRQAGRYLPEYRKIRASSKNFLDMCLDPKKAYEITMQPLNRFDLDAAIIFSDILVLPYLLGWNVDFKENIGPSMPQFHPDTDQHKLSQNFHEDLFNILGLITKLSRKLSPSQTLIGFVGAPWTIATYMIEGKGKTNMSRIRKFAYENNSNFAQFIEFLTYKTIDYLLAQINSGVEMIQIFESSAGNLPWEIFQQFVIHPTKIIVRELKKHFPNVPIICFPKYTKDFYFHYAYEIMPDGIGVDFLASFDMLQKLQKDFVVQGCLDPAVLLCNQKNIRSHLYDIFSHVDKKNFIFNLGDGILPDTPIKNLDYLIELIKKFNQGEIFS